MGLSGHVCLPLARCMGLVVLLTGTQHCFFAATNVTGITHTEDTTRINDITDVTHITDTISTAPSTAATSTTTATTAAATTTATTPETTSNPNHFFINLNTSCATGQLKVNLSFFNETRQTINISGTCDGDTHYVKDFISLATQNQKITTTTTTTTTPSTTTTSTDGTTASSTTTTTTSTTGDHSTASSTTSVYKSTKYLWSGIGIGAGAVVLPCLVSLLLYVFRRRICSSCRRRKESDDGAGTGRTESDTSGQRPRAGMNPHTSTCHDSPEAETDVSRSGYGNTGFQASTFEGIPALPRKTSVFSIHEDDEDNRGNSFNGFFVPEPNQAPESDYDQLPIGRKPLETTATDAGDDDEAGLQGDYMNILEARGAHHQAEQEEYLNYPAISC